MMKEADIRRREAHNRYLALVEQDLVRLLADRSSFVTIRCPACGEGEHIPQFEKSVFAYVLCRECETLFVNPRPAYKDLMRLYAESESTRYWVEEFFRPMAEVRREKIFRPRAEYVAGRFPHLQGGVIGDIGAGFGLFLQELRGRWPAATLVAIEPSQEMAAICRGLGFDVLEAMLEDVDPSRHRFDLLVSFELFEHLYDPLQFLRKTHALLRPGGHLVLTTLNGLGFDIQLLWERAKSVSPPHLNFLNPGSMARLLTRAGFVVEEVSTPGELDWDIVEGVVRHDGVDAGRLIRTIIRHGTDEARRDLQAWIRRHNLSSHMRIIARKENR